MKHIHSAMSLSDAINNRRSVRSYSSERIDRNTVNTLVSAAVRAPNARDEQQWAFVVVQGRPELKHLSQLTRSASAAGLAHIHGTLKKEMLESFNDPDFNLFYDADTLILICAKKNEQFVDADCWLAAENLMLTACAIGLGSCVIGSAVTGLNSLLLKSELGISDEVVVVVPIIIGIPYGDLPVVKRSHPEILAWHDGTQE